MSSIEARDSTGFVNDSSSDYADSDGISAAASMRSDVMEHVSEHGRTYHRYKEGRYMFPNDAAEMNRYDIVHGMFLLALQGRLYLSPSEDARNVLDIGSATGIWPLEFAEGHPDASVLGIDLSPVPIGWKPPNCRFLVDDVEGQWVYGQPFDFIMQRTMCGSISDWSRLFKQGFANLASGGWYEMQEVQVDMFFQDNTDRESSAVVKWLTHLDKATEKVGCKLNVAASLEPLFVEAGFVDVHHEIIRIPYGTWPRWPDQHTLGKYSTLSFVDGLEAMSLAPFIQVLGWSEADLTSLLQQVRNEFLDGRRQMYTLAHIIYGRKP